MGPGRPTRRRPLQNANLPEEEKNWKGGVEPRATGAPTPRHVRRSAFPGFGRDARKASSHATCRASSRSEEDARLVGRSTPRPSARRLPPGRRRGPAGNGDRLVVLPTTGAQIPRSASRWTRPVTRDAPHAGPARGATTRDRPRRPQPRRPTRPNRRRRAGERPRAARPPPGRRHGERREDQEGRVTRPPRRRARARPRTHPSTRFGFARRAGATRPLSPTRRDATRRRPAYGRGPTDRRPGRDERTDGRRTARSADRPAATRRGATGGRGSRGPRPRRRPRAAAPGPRRATST